MLQRVMSQIAAVKKDMIILEKSEFSTLLAENEVSLFISNRPVFFVFLFFFQRNYSKVSSVRVILYVYITERHLLSSIEAQDPTIAA